MGRFRKLSHSIWHCQYHIVWVPKYRFKLLTGPVASEVERCLRAFSEQNGAEVVELNVQIDHVHLLVLVPPKIAISSFVGILKGRSAIRVFNKFRKLKKNPIGAIISGPGGIVSIPLVWTKRKYASM